MILQSQGQLGGMQCIVGQVNLAPTRGMQCIVWGEREGVTWCISVS